MSSSNKRGMRKRGARAALGGSCALGFVAVTVACSGNGSTFDPQNGRGGGAAQGGGGSSAGTGNGGNGGTLIVPDGGAGSSGTDGGGGVCSKATSKAALTPVYLAFAFDASASMGMPPGPGVPAYWDKSLKWDPVKAAAESFFSAPASQGISASLTFFPALGGADWCSASEYTPVNAPNVPMRALNGSTNNPFVTGLDAVEPTLPQRLATPTLAVMTGTLNYVNKLRQAKPGKYAIVLVTDGYPQSCPDRNGDPIQPVIDLAHNAYTNDKIPTYVIGVKNPPVDNAPDTVSALSQIATQAGTQPFFIDTSDPTTTSKTFKAAVDKIRGSSVSCNVGIPKPPAGQTFDKRRVRVLYQSGNKPAQALAYDAACSQANVWKYDNASAPTQIDLCPSTCSTVQADPNASLSVEFTCEQVIDIPE